MVRTYPLIYVFCMSGFRETDKKQKERKVTLLKWRHQEIRSVEAPRNKENRGTECGVKGPISWKNKDILGWNKMMVKVGSQRQQTDK